MAQYIKGYIPDAKIDVYLDGNNSSLEFECSEEEQRILNNKMYTFIKEIEK